MRREGMSREELIVLAQERQEELAGTRWGRGAPKPPEWGKKDNDAGSWE
jgi:hypothetical protein